VNLRIEIVENPDTVTDTQELSGEVRPDETGAPDDEYRLCQFNPRFEPRKRI
jgi:hypothetical protein